MGNSESVWKEIKRKTNAKGGNPASPRNPKKSVRQAASGPMRRNDDKAAVKTDRRLRRMINEAATGAHNLPEPLQKDSCSACVSRLVSNRMR